MSNKYSLKSGLASDPTVWSGGAVPASGDRVLICVGHTVTLDGTYEWGDDSTATVVINAISTTKSITVRGVLAHSRTVNSQLTCNGIFLVDTGGLHDAGTVASPIPQGVTAKILLNKSAAMVNGKYMYSCPTQGKVSFCGVYRKRVAKLTAVANIGATSIQVDDATGWQVGDRVHLGADNPTTTYGTAPEYENFTIAAGYTPGALTVPLSAATTKIHCLGQGAANLTSNVVVTSYSASLPGSFYLESSYLDIANSRFVNNTLFEDLSVAYPYYGAVFGVTANYTSVQFTNPYGTVDSCAFVSSLTGNPLAKFDCGSYDQPLKVANCFFGATVSFANATQVPAVQVGSNVTLSGGMISTSINPIGRTATRLENVLVAVPSGAFSAGAGSFPTGITLDSCLFSGSKGSYGSLANLTADMQYINCDFGYTLTANGAACLLKLQSCMSIVHIDFTGCLFSAAVAVFPDATSQNNITPDSYIRITNKNKDVTQQEDYRQKYTMMRNNSVFNRGLSSVSMKANYIGVACPRTLAIPCGNGKTVRIIGYVKADAAFYNGGGAGWNAPTVTLSGLGITPVTFTASSAANNAWEKYDLSATNTSGYDGNLTLTYSINAKSVTTGTVYFDGVPDSPFVTKVRHYGFLFDETNPARTINPIVQASEAVAAAYTGLTVNSVLPKITVGAGSINSFQKLYDAMQAWACLNVDKEPLLSSTDGINFNLALTTRIEWSGMGQDGVLAGGCLVIAPGAHAYKLTGSKVEFSQAGSYNMAACQINGTLTLSNASAGAVTVYLPPGTSYTNAGPAITVLIDNSVTLTLTGIIPGSDVVILDAGTSSERQNIDSVATSSYAYQFTSGGAVDICVYKAGYIPFAIRNYMLPAANSTLPINQSTDRNYLP